VCLVTTASNKETYCVYCFHYVGADEREIEDNEFHWDDTVYFNDIGSILFKIEIIFIHILCIIQNEERLQPDPEDKEGCKGGTNEEAYQNSETYHYATPRHCRTILRFVSINTQYILYFFLTHFWIFRLISRSPNSGRFDCMIRGDIFS